VGGAGLGHAQLHHGSFVSGTGLLKGRCSARDCLSSFVNLWYRLVGIVNEDQWWVFIQALPLLVEDVWILLDDLADERPPANSDPIQVLAREACETRKTLSSIPELPKESEGSAPMLRRGCPQPNELNR